jgi:uroporphyrinogen-III synthase
LCGFDLIELPTARLNEVELSKDDSALIQQADLLIFPSPFAIESSLRRALVLFEGRQQPWIALVGQGSYHTILQGYPEVDLTRVISPKDPPFDAEHLAPLIANVFAASSDQKSLKKVVLFTADATTNSLFQWQQWLASSSQVQSVTSYVSLPIKLRAPEFPETADTDFFYCTSSSSIAALSTVIHRSPASVRVPIAITIHPNISREVEKQLGWRVVEIGPGAQALINCLKAHDNERL